MTAWRLVPRPATPFAAVAAITAGAGVALLGRHFTDTSGPTFLDSRIDGNVVAHLSRHPHALDLMTRAGSPTALAAVCAVLTLVCLLARRWRGALFAVSAAPLAAILTEKVLKPLIHRTTVTDAFTFPSGHTTGACALAMTTVVLLLPHRGVVRAPVVVLRLALAAGVLAVAAGTAVAVVALRWHYASDTVGGAGVAVAVVLTVALLLDLLGGLVSPAPARGAATHRALLRTPPASR